MGWNEAIGVLEMHRMLRVNWDWRSKKWKGNFFPRSSFISERFWWINFEKSWKVEDFLGLFLGVRIDDECLLGGNSNVKSVHAIWPGNKLFLRGPAPTQKHDNDEECWVIICNLSMIPSAWITPLEEEPREHDVEKKFKARNVTRNRNRIAH